MADQGSEGLLSPYLRNQRFKAALPYLKGAVLDVGCGAGGVAENVAPADFCGVEVDIPSLNVARSKHPQHEFYESLSSVNRENGFDTVISLAVIEHVKNPEQFMIDLSQYLSDAQSARIIITTPHPSMDWVHDLGAKFGLFSQHANEEHEELLDKEKLDIVGKAAGLKLVHYNRFLFGANQLAVYERSL